MNIKRLIKESNLIEGIDDPKEIDQSLVAWEYLQYVQTLRHADIMKVQKIITLNQTDLRPNERGYYRDMSKVNVQVGGHICPDYGYVPGMMDNWLLDYDNLEPFEAHRRFERIHPFVDGNGRTGRMLMWWQEAWLNRELTPILFKNRQEYYASLTNKPTSKLSKEETE